MDIDFEEKMAGETDEYLKTYIENRQKYVPAATLAALAELQKRGHVFDDTMLQQIKTDIEIKEGLRINQDNIAAVNEADTEDLFARAPLYYSEKAIWGFSIFFATVFGAVLLAINLRGRKSQSLTVVLFGLLYSIAVAIVVNQFPEANRWLSIGLNGIGGAILTKFFWPRYLGKDIQYRAKLIWIPLLISILIITPFILAVIFFQ